MADNPKIAFAGINLSNTTSQIKEGQLTWATNAVLYSFSGNKITYCNEQGNDIFISIPDGYRVIGHRHILEEKFTIYWITNPITKDCQIGKDVDGVFSTVVSSPCLNLDIDYPILKHTHRNTNCGLEVYWVDGRNRARYIQLEKLPYKQQDDPGSCSTITTNEIDCNKLNLQPDFKIPTIEVKEASSGGNILAGSYQFSAQYSNSLTEPYTSFYSTTNPGSIFIDSVAVQDFDFPTGKAIEVNLSGIDTSGIFDYINIAVIKTVNNISSVDLVGTYKIEGSEKSIIYTGQSIQKLDINDIFQRYELYDAPSDLTVAQDTLILGTLKGEERISYQKIANRIKVYWQTNRLRGDKPYSKLDNTVNMKGFMRDEVYPLSLVLELDNGHITDHFPLIGRTINDFDKEIINNDDVISAEKDICNQEELSLPRYKVYNTATSLGKLHLPDFDDCYEGPWEYGEFAYWESSETYDCNKDIWGDLAGQPIRHFKFPDSSITHIHDNQGYIYPVGIRIDVDEVIRIIKESDLSEAIKSRIKGFKIVRGNRVNNESVIAKGLINNVLKYRTDGNIINPKNGEASTINESTAESSTRNMLDKAYEFTNKAHKEFNSSAFLSWGTIAVGNNYQQNRRYHYVEDMIDSIRDSENLFTEENLSRLQQIDEDMDRLMSNSLQDKKGQAHVMAAQSLIRGLQEIIKSQMEINTIIQENSINILPEVSDYNKYNYFPNYLFNDIRINENGSPSDFFLSNTIIDDDVKKRYSFHSPDTSFYQPELGNVIKLETIEQGISSGHLTEVKKHARYQFISKSGYLTAILAGVSIATLSGSYGVGSVNIINGEAGFTAYQAFLDILYKTVPFKNFAYQWDAVGDYSSYLPVPNAGNKQRLLDLSLYMGAGMQNMGDNHTVNNYQRESSVYLRSTKTLPFTHEQGGVRDSSKMAVPSYEVLQMPISSYYAAIKRNLVNQYGQIGSYEVVDTGFRISIDLTSNANYGWKLIMGGDTFINKFAYKSKFPFFIDNRVNFPDGADISYNELSNVGRVKFWFSTDTVTTSSVFDSFFATMTQRFFWPEINELYMGGKIFLFAYGIPYFFCESTVNVDMRQAFNNKEGDFYPHVSSGIPGDWLQEYNVPIAQDNTYFYNKSFSKQNKETFFSGLPIDYDFNNCRTEFPFRAIFSEPTTDNPNPSLRNNWRIFKPAARFDFPQNYGKLISLDGIENKQVLARFQNKTLLYNALAVAPTNTQSIYLGSSLFNRNVPPLDYAETDGGYIGTEHKLFLRTPYGHVTIDTVRGQIFLLQGQKAQNISGELDLFLSEFADFQISKYFNISIDNSYKGIGWCGLYDNRYNRIILTKLDYQPIVKGIEFKNSKFYYGGKEIQLKDTKYFCNYSFTISYSFDTNTWISFHTYFPNFYIEVPDKFRSGKNNGVWVHGLNINKFNNFYDEIHPYTIEYPYRFSINDEILQDIQDYSRVYEYLDIREPLEVDNKYFNKLIITGPYQTSGLLELVQKPENNLMGYNKYPKYNINSKEILYTKTNSVYRINTFWSLLRDKKKPIWIKDCESLSNYKKLNESNLNYSKLSYKKEPIRGKDLRVRFTLDDKDDINIISEFVLAKTTTSHK